MYQHSTEIITHFPSFGTCVPPYSEIHAVFIQQLMEVKNISHSVVWRGQKSPGRQASKKSFTWYFHWTSWARSKSFGLFCRPKDLWLCSRATLWEKQLENRRNWRAAKRFGSLSVLTYGMFVKLLKNWTLIGSALGLQVLQTFCTNNL